MLINRQIIAIKKLKNGDLAIYVDNLMAKKEMESAMKWANRITKKTIIKKRI
jgi:hypothetical protein